MPHLHIADNQAGECVKAKHIGIAGLCYNGNLLRAFCLNAQAAGIQYHQFIAVIAALPIVILAAQTAVVGRLRQIVLPRLKENGCIWSDGRQKFIHIGDMNLTVLPGLHLGCFRELYRLPRNGAHFHSAQIPARQFCTIRGNGADFSLCPFSVGIEAAALHCHRSAISAEDCLHPIVVDVQSAQV